MLLHMAEVHSQVERVLIDYSGDSLWRKKETQIVDFGGCVLLHRWTQIRGPSYTERVDFSGASL